MDYKKYVQKHGSIEAAEIIKERGFPKSGKWDDLKIFVNINDVSEGITVELEQLYDNYHLQRQGVVRWLNHKLKTAIPKLQMRYLKYLQSNL